MSSSKCPNCDAIIPLTSDAFCPDCREPIQPNSTPDNSSTDAVDSEFTQVATFADPGTVEQPEILLLEDENITVTTHTITTKTRTHYVGEIEAIRAQEYSKNKSVGIVLLVVGALAASGVILPGVAPILRLAVFAVFVAAAVVSFLSPKPTFAVIATKNGRPIQIYESASRDEIAEIVHVANQAITATKSQPKPAPPQQ